MVPSHQRRAVAILLLTSILPAGCQPRTAPPVAVGASRAVSFCFWNVENFFDDQNDRRPEADEPFDDWYAAQPAMLRLKLDRLTEALLRLNDGKGPDILALVEVECVRAADLLRQALNARLRDAALHYPHVLMKDLDAGRHIAPAIITRLPVVANKTQLHGRQLRILEGHVTVNGHDLVLIAAHWSARTSDATGERRAKYGDQIYGVFKAMHRTNPKVALLVSADCNDNPDDPSITQHLHAIGDPAKVLGTRGDPLLFNLLAGKAPRDFGTHTYRGQPLIFDQIFISPALLDGASGWTCLPETVRVIDTLTRPGDRQRRPWRFGGPGDQGARGYSDHFPVTVQLKVRGGD